MNFIIMKLHKEKKKSFLVAQQWRIHLQCKGHRFDPWVRKIPWRRGDSPLQYSCQENPMDRAAWRATVHGVAKSWTWVKWLSMYTQKEKREEPWYFKCRINKREEWSKCFNPKEWHLTPSIICSPISDLGLEKANIEFLLIYTIWKIHIFIIWWSSSLSFFFSGASLMDYEIYLGEIKTQKC